MLVVFTGQQPDGVGQKPATVAKTLQGRGIHVYTMGAGLKFSKPQTLWTASSPGNAYHAYKYQGKNDLVSEAKPLADDILNGELLKTTMIIKYCKKGL